MRTQKRDKFLTGKAKTSRYRLVCCVCVCVCVCVCERIHLFSFTVIDFYLLFIGSVLCFLLLETCIPLFSIICLFIFAISFLPRIAVSRFFLQLP